MSEGLVTQFRLRFASLRWRINALVVLLCVLPPLWSSPGQVSADTKSYLYLDPARLLSRATSLWDPSVGAGTVAHQVAGYLWPMGPYFWFMEQLGCPDWIAQRLWWSLLALAASFGVLRLSRLLGIGDAGACIAAFSYAFSPYSLQYLARLSGLLTPWALLPWMLICVIRARDGRPSKWGLALGLLLATAGSVNVTALAMVFIGVVVWMLVDIVTGVVRVRRHLSLLATALSTALVCGSWWITALVVQGRYGLPILRYTETYETVAKASTPQEILRGLGYWFFYGSDHSGAWVTASTRLIGTTPLLAIGMLMTAIALASLGLARHRHTRHCVALVVIGLAVAVGANPQGSSSLYGQLFETIVNNESGFALRSSPRAAPVLLVALAVSLGFAFERVCASMFVLRRRTLWKWRMASWGVLCLLLAVQNYPWMTGRLLTPSIARDEHLPAYWNDTANAIKNPHSNPSLLTRTYELPGVDFATYTWGGTIDPVTPGLIDSQYIARELVPYGSDATADLLNAYETRLQEGRFEASSLRDFAAILGADTVTFRGDVQYDTYRTPNPGRLWQELSAANLDTRYESAMVDSVESATIADATYLSHPRAEKYPATAVFAVDPQPLVTVSPLSKHTRLVGSGDGVVDAISALGRVKLGTFIYDATATLTGLDFGSPSQVLITDSNRRQSRRWYSVGSNLGRTESSEEETTADASDNRLMPFVDDHTMAVPASTQSVSLLVGDIKDISSSNHGHPIVSTPEDRPEHAFDGDPYTAWRTGIIGPSIGQFIEARFNEPVTTTEVTLTWPRFGNTERRITKGHLLLLSPTDGSESRIDFSVPDQSPMTRVSFARSTFDRLRIVIDDDTFGARDVYDGLPGTGIADVAIPGVRSSEYILLPRPTHDAKGIADTTYLLTRWRLDEATPNRSDPESRLMRAFDVDAPRNMKLTGTVRLNGNVQDSLLIQTTSTGPATATSNRRMLGSPFTSAMNVLDDNDDSAWVTPFDAATGSTVAFTGLNASRDVEISFIDDELHSRPTKMSLTFSDGSTTTVLIPNTGSSVALRLPSSRVLTSLAIEGVESRYYPDYFSLKDRELPVAITEVRIDRLAPRALLEGAQQCRSDLLKLNGTTIAVRVAQSLGTSTSPWRGDAVLFESCGDLNISAGRNYLEATSGRVSGWNLDRIVLSPVEAREDIGAFNTAVSTADLITSDRTRIVARVNTVGKSLVAVATSNNRGWKASFTDDNGAREIAKSFIVNGYSHGVIVPGPGIVTFEWSPQTWYRYAMWLSFLAGISALIALFVMARRTARTPMVVHDRQHPVSTVASIVAFLVFFVAAPPLAVGALSVVIVFTKIRRRVEPALLVTVAAIAYLGLTAWTVSTQIMRRYPITLDWPGRFEDWGVVAWIAVGLVAMVGWVCDVPQQQHSDN